MFKIRRVTTEPASAIHILVDQPEGDGDGGFTRAGSFFFFPAGSEDGPDAHHVNPAAAAGIMGDPGIAHHFECTPPWTPAPVAEPIEPVTEGDPPAGSVEDVAAHPWKSAEQPSAQPDSASDTRRGRRVRGRAEQPNEKSGG